MSTQSIRLARTNTLSPAVLICIAVMVALVAFSGGLLELVRRWSAQEEYSHGFLIPVVAAWMLWSRRDAVFASVGRPSWIGVLLISVAGMMLIVGELSAFYLLSQLGFVVVLLGIVLAIGGISLLKVTFIPIAFLVFAIPLPYFIDSELSCAPAINLIGFGRLFHQAIWCSSLSHRVISSISEITNYR